MSETCQKLAFTHPIVGLESGLKNNWMKKLDRVNRLLKVSEDISGSRWALFGKTISVDNLYYFVSVNELG